MFELRDFPVCERMLSLYEEWRTHSDEPAYCPSGRIRPLEEWSSALDSWIIILKRDIAFYEYLDEMFEKMT